MQATLRREAIQGLLDEGRTEKVLKEIALAMSEMDDLQEMEPWCALEAWAYFWRGEYNKAWNAVAAAGPKNLDALECRAYLAAHEEDDEFLMQIEEKFPDSILVTTAFVIRACDGDFPEWTHEAVVGTLSRFSPQGDLSETKYANLISNVGRFFHIKSRDERDHWTALEFLDLALEKYGTGDKDLHHRAEALYWQSKVLEELKEMGMACNPAIKSFQLLSRQVELDPTNPVFKQRLERSKKRLLELGVNPDRLL